MSQFSLDHGSTIGPLGFPMTDKAAQALESLLAATPEGKDYEYRKLITPKSISEINDGERSDVSWITTEALDHQGEVFLAKGMDVKRLESALEIVKKGTSGSVPSNKRGT